MLTVIPGESFGLIPSEPSLQATGILNALFCLQMQTHCNRKNQLLHQSRNLSITQIQVLPNYPFFEDAVFGSR
jgi:hypothetical protein